MASSKGLGKGLGALLGDFTEESTEKSPYQRLPIHKVEPNRSQPRQDFDEVELEELSESIRTHGVIQPLTVRELPSGYYQIIAGERRWRASRMAGLSEIPAVIIEADDKKAMELALIENLQRQDLNPVEEALGYQALINEYGLTQEEAANRVGKSRPAVANALRLLSLSGEVLEKLRSKHPIIPAIMDYRMLTKLKSTYAEGLIKQIGGDGRIHTTFQNLVTATGRLSSTEPNLQNIPVRTDLGAEIRKCLFPKKVMCWWMRTTARSSCASLAISQRTRPCAQPSVMVWISTL